MVPLGGKIVRGKQPGEGPRARAKLVRAPIFDNASSGQDQNSREAGYGGKTVRHHENRGCSKVTSDIVKHELFRHRIKARGGFIQDENSGALQHCPRDGNTLPLTPRKATACRPDLLAKTIIEGCEEGRESRVSKGCFQLVI